jgi:hypothetical protein
MRFRDRNRARVCGPEIIFEELEQRIVLDASMDSTAVNSHAGGLDPVHGLLSGLAREMAPGHENAHHGGTADWNLEYSSDPSVKMAPVLDRHDLALADVELGTPVPAIQLYAVPTVRDDSPVSNGLLVADLSGAVRITGDPTKSLFMTVAANPRPLTSDGIASLFFKDTTAVDVSIGGSGTLWTLDGRVDSINAVLATMQATVNSCFNGFAQIDITLTDVDHATSAATSPLVDKTLYIPVDRMPHEPAASVPSPQTIPSNTWFSLPVSVLDKDTNEVGVVLWVEHGVLSVPSDICSTEGLVSPPVTYFGTEGPDGRPLEQGPRVGVRGPISNLQSVLSQVQYRSFPGYRGDDQLTVTVKDESYLPKPNICQGSIWAVTPINVI